MRVRRELLRTAVTGREHWERVYRESGAADVSWYQPHLAHSFELIRATGVSAGARLVDVGGGASSFVRWVGTRVEPGDAMLIGDIGCAGMYTKARVIDYFGVIDPNIAHQDLPSLGRGKAGHEKTASFQYVMDQRPRFMKWGYLHGATALSGSTGTTSTRRFPTA